MCIYIYNLFLLLSVTIVHFPLFFDLKFGSKRWIHCSPVATKRTAIFFTSHTPDTASCCIRWSVAINWFNVVSASLYVRNDFQFPQIKTNICRPLCGHIYIDWVMGNYKMSVMHGFQNRCCRDISFIKWVSMKKNVKKFIQILFTNTFPIS